MIDATRRDVPLVSHVYQNTLDTSTSSTNPVGATRGTFWILRSKQTWNYLVSLQLKYHSLSELGWHVFPTFHQHNTTLGIYPRPNGPFLNHYTRLFVTILQLKFLVPVHNRKHIHTSYICRKGMLQGLTCSTRCWQTAFLWTRGFCSTLLKVRVQHTNS